jgi:hypothetical protein
MMIDNLPYAPYWDNALVEVHLEEAAKVMRSLPPVRVQGYFSVWPESVSDEWILSANQEPEERRLRYTPRQISKMEFVMEWLLWPPIVERKIIWERANGVPWKVLEHRYQSSRTTLWRNYSHGMMWIVAKLNAKDPDGEKIRTYLY